MKKKYLIANWKGYLDARQSRKVAATLCSIRIPRAVTAIVCPSDSALADVTKVLHGSSIQIGSQNIDLTGRRSVRAAKDLGCRYVIVGHSSRRASGETDAMIARKLNLVERSGLTPILCVGESAKQHKAGQTNAVIEKQLSRVLKTFHGKQLIIAYEPVWAISVAGKGIACPPSTAFATAGHIRAFFRKKFPRLRVTLLYGGSVSSTNIAQYVDGKHFVGALVGFASTKPAEVKAMLRALS